MEAVPLDLVAWSTVVGTLLPLVISLLKGANMTTQVKRTIALIVSIIASVITTGANQGWVYDSVTDFLQLIILSFFPVYSLAQTTYLGFWKDTAIETRLEQVGSNG